MLGKSILIWSSVATLFCLLHICSARAALYAISGTGNTNVISTLYEIDPNTGSVIQTIGSTGLSHFTSLAVHPITGELYAHQSQPATNNGSLYRLDPNTGIPSLVGHTHVTISDLSFNSLGELFGWMEFHDPATSGFANEIADRLVQLDTQDGDVSIVADFGLFPFTTGLAFDSSDSLFLKNANIIHQLNPLDATETIIAAMNVLPANVLAFGPQDVAYTVERTQEAESVLQTIELSTGEVTNVGNINISGEGVFGITALAFAFMIPEPTTLTLTFIALWLSCRRYR